MILREPATCKFCGCDVVLRIDSDCERFNVESWKKIAACNRCADARRLMYQSVDRIMSAAAGWRQQILYGDEQKGDVRAPFQNKFTFLTKVYCQACCEAFRQPNQWEPKLLNDLMQRPQNAYAILKDYQSSFKPLVVQAEPPPELAPTLPEMDPF